MNISACRGKKELEVLVLFPHVLYHNDLQTRSLSNEQLTFRLAEKVAEFNYLSKHQELALIDCLM